jgi:uncharacterized protein with PhoU and TrkA domain
MEVQELVDKVCELESKLYVYSDFWGPDSEEVYRLENEIHELNMEILDHMVEEAI